ncbi:hypothetical protein BCR34DRAFT_272432 [Clohesyomyces aquaticus]|uniref:Uncharacterized protein n=1 Tax=Clohesyomyces aquaticus TaxID=1231657 RepID=A0A1Y1ZSS5_9PLEO|nr:hypothetical protein BCR34DRAFT_272432 [Clohesyomyces aquaticus]
MSLLYLRLIFTVAAASAVPLAPPGTAIRRHDVAAPSRSGFIVNAATDSTPSFNYTEIDDLPSETPEPWPTPIETQWTSMPIPTTLPPPHGTDHTGPDDKAVWRNCAAWTLIVYSAFSSFLLCLLWATGKVNATLTPASPSSNDRGRRRTVPPDLSYRRLWGSNSGMTSSEPALRYTSTSPVRPSSPASTTIFTPEHSLVRTRPHTTPSAMRHLASPTAEIWIRTDADVDERTDRSLRRYAALDAEMRRLGMIG